MGRFVDLIRVMRDSCSRQMERVELAHLLVERWAYTVLRILVRTPRRCYLTAVVKIARHFQGHRMPRLDVDQIFAMIDKDSLKVELVGPARLSKELKTEEEHAAMPSICAAGMPRLIVSHMHRSIKCMKRGNMKPLRGET